MTDETKAEIALSETKTIVVAGKGSASWGAYSHQNGLQCTFLPHVASSDKPGVVAYKDSQWQFSVNSVFLNLGGSGDSSKGESQKGSEMGVKGGKKGDSDKDKDKDTDTDPWNRLHRAIGAAHKRPMWCVFILRSGKFAGAIFDGNRYVYIYDIYRFTLVFDIGFYIDWCTGFLTLVLYENPSKKTRVLVH